MVSFSFLHSKYETISHAVIYSLPLKGIIKDVIEKLVMDSKNFKFVLGYTVNEDNNASIVVLKHSRINPIVK